ncbi:glutaredoxin [Pontibacillus yanchengensis Y32]|uniref:Glutaredoxin n=1 Tax=Pontibacillus yanchengensis Y32 TaxID=1385514 RepID=A0A0A2TEQ8_9BACI|nr:glutaredoxin [Pontibacillus yanchengensis Y32]
MILYGKKDCHLCEDAKAVLKELQGEFDFTIKELDIYEDDRLLERYQVMIPVVEIDGEEVDFGQISEHLIRNRLHQKNA